MCVCTMIQIPIFYTFKARTGSKIQDLITESLIQHWLNAGAAQSEALKDFYIALHFIGRCALATSQKERLSVVPYKLFRQQWQTDIRQ